MLILCFLPDPAEGAHFVSKICNQDITFDRMPGDESWEGCQHSDKHDQDRCGKLVPMVEKTINNFSSLILPSSSQVSISNNMSDRLTPLRVYHRKKLHTNSPDICPAQTSVYNKNGDNHSAYSSETHSRATKEHLASIETGTGSPCRPLVKCSTEGLASKSGSFSGSLDGEESDEGFRSETGRVMDICCIDDSCSSSKLNLVSAALKTDGDDSAECSSSGGLVSEGLWENMSEREICISIIRTTHGLVETASCLQDSVSTGDNAMPSDQNCCSRTCKVCGHSETSSKMLICDQCEDAFHTSCCNPRLKLIPIDEWFCYSCLKKKRKILKKKSCNAPANISNEDELGPIEDMLRDIKPFKSSVRIGNEYQVDVPDWSGPETAENAIREPEEIKESEYLPLHDANSSKTRLSSIGNWLQCQELIEGIGEDIDGTICGKWRRAPLFKSQTDDWECFRAVLWDPAHADCAVPQELPTDEVLKQLKYIEMLRPRLAAKKRKLDQIKTVDSEVPKEA